MTRSDAERFADILNAIDRCQDYAQYDAVLHNLGVIGEAVRAHCLASSATAITHAHVASRALGFRRLWRHNGAMPSVQIKDVPDETHAVLRQRAAAAHQSLQEYLRSRLIEEASRPTLDEVLDRAAGRAGGRVPIKSAVSTLRAERARR